MRDGTEWIQLTPPTGREADLGEPGLGAAIHDIVKGRSSVGNAGMEVGAQGTQPQTAIEDTSIHGLQDEQAAAILCTGRTIAADSVEQRTGPRSNGRFLRNIDPREHARTIGSSVGNVTPYSLRQAQLRIEELAAANHRKDEFLAVLGHELRNPLTSINNGIRLLSHQTQESPARQKTQAMIQRQVRRMTQLVQDLLDVSRIAHGRLHLQRQRIDLRDVVSNAIETLESDINERHHRLTTELPDAPVWLHADPGRLEQVFINLLANASRYTDAGGELTVWMHTRDGQAVVRVRDSGIGIAPEVLPNLFDLFTQADEASPRSQSGLGIGLKLVRDLVESHGGSVTGASAGLGQGSEFTVRLPREY